MNTQSGGHPATHPVDPNDHRSWKGGSVEEPHFIRVGDEWRVFAKTRVMTRYDNGKPMESMWRITVRRVPVIAGLVGGTILIINAAVGLSTWLFADKLNGAMRSAVQEEFSRRDMTIEGVNKRLEDHIKSVELLQPDYLTKLEVEHRLDKLDVRLSEIDRRVYHLQGQVDRLP